MNVMVKLARTEQKTIGRKSFESPDETRRFEKGKVELVSIGGVTVGRMTLEPGWKWSQHVKPIARTDSCQAAHTGYGIAGRIHVVMNDGSEVEYGPGDIQVIPPGHDAWVIGNETYVGLDFSGLADYAKSSK